jgi:hypothetical protein
LQFKNRWQQLQGPPSSKNYFINEHGKSVYHSKEDKRVADKVYHAKHEIFDACQDIITKKKSYNEVRTKANDNDRLDLSRLKSLYETSYMVKYYIGDNPVNITPYNRRLWPLRHWVYSDISTGIYDIRSIFIRFYTYL